MTRRAPDNPAGLWGASRPYGTECQHGRHLCPQCDAEYIARSSNGLESSRPQWLSGSRYGKPLLETSIAYRQVWQIGAGR